MRKTVDVVPPNSVLLVMDRSVGEVPDQMGGGLVSASRSCIAVGTLSAADGSTQIILADDDALPAGMPVFEGCVPTPSRVLSVCSVNDEPLVEMSVLSEKTNVRVWVNHNSEPDLIEIVVRSAE